MKVLLMTSDSAHLLLPGSVSKPRQIVTGMPGLRLSLGTEDREAETHRQLGELVVY